MAFLVWWGEKGVIIKWASWGQCDRVLLVIAIVILVFAVREKFSLEDTWEVFV